MLASPEREALACSEVGSWVVEPVSYPNCFHDVRFNKSRFPEHKSYTEPPDHYLDLPQPKIFPSYSIGVQRPVSKTLPPTVPSSNNFQGKIQTLSSGAIQKPPQQREFNFSHSPFSKIPRPTRRSTGKVSLSKSTSYVPPAERDLPAHPTFDFNTLDTKTSLQYTITVSKRSNGNQPWEASNVRPPMLGKMRRMTLQFAPFEGDRFEVLFQCRDMKPQLHEGRLIVSANDKGLGRNSTSSMPLNETIFRTNLVPSDVTQVINVYLKPCWKGFGSNRERPVFSVTVAIRPAEKECAFVILHSWEVELHSHKMESSNKGKAMDANGPFEVRGSIPLQMIDQTLLSREEEDAEDDDGTRLPTLSPPEGLD